MRPARVWLNRGFSHVYDALTLIREEDPDRRQVILCASHERPQSATLTVADEAWLEPAIADTDAYVDWCLGTARARSIDLFYPQRAQTAIAAAAGDFVAIGTRILTAGSAEALGVLGDKGLFYRALQERAVAVPDFAVCDNSGSFTQHVSELRTLHPRLCAKPTVGQYASGFVILEDPGDRFEQIMSGNMRMMSANEFARVMAAAKTPRPMIVMPFLEGPERSIDILALDGRLITAVSRIKHPFHQELELLGPAIDLAHRIVHAFDLSGVVNLQTRDHAGSCYPLEVNPRMSGGILYACQAGVTLPYWAILLTLDRARPEEVPLPVEPGALALVNRVVEVGGERYL